MVPLFYQSFALLALCGFLLAHDVQIMQPTAPLKTSTLLNYLGTMSGKIACHNKPLIITMAQVSSPLYWQLVENFFFTMQEYGHFECSLMVCVSDKQCMKQCDALGFPCFDYSPAGTQHVMEQIATIKIYYVGKALAIGIDILILDLDVGFLQDPLLLAEGFLENKYEHLRAQMDVSWGMDHSTRVYFTWPRLNFGIFLIKASECSVRIFQVAWEKYLTDVKPERKRLVAIDQNVVSGVIFSGHSRCGFNMSYFDIGYKLDKPGNKPIRKEKAYLLHKIDHVSPSTGIKFELGGLVAREELKGVIAVHATCYEKATKLMGLKASNAYRSPRHYLAQRRTLTKAIMFISRKQLRDELTALFYLAAATDRNVVMPNVLLGTGSNIVGQHSLADCRNAVANSHLKQPSYSLTRNCQALKDKQFTKGDNSSFLNYSHAAFHRGEYYWPAFRIVDESVLPPELKFLDASYYFHVKEAVNRQKKTDKYVADKKSLSVRVPSPFVSRIDIAHALGLVSSEGGTDDVLSKQHVTPPGISYVLDKIKNIDSPRLVLDMYDSLASDNGASVGGRPNNINEWAKDSVGCWGENIRDKVEYVSLPSVDSTAKALKNKARTFEEANGWSIKLCRLFLSKPNNLTCFDKCN